MKTSYRCQAHPVAAQLLRLGSLCERWHVPLDSVLWNICRQCGAINRAGIHCTYHNLRVHAAPAILAASTSAWTKLPVRHPDPHGRTCNVPGAQLAPSSSEEIQVIVVQSIGF